MEWIDVKDLKRRPTPGTHVLVSNGKRVLEALYTNDGKWLRGGAELFCMIPTHWTPMPEPPAAPQQGLKEYIAIFSRTGTASVMARSYQEVWAKADALKASDVKWDDDFIVTDIAKNDP